jgi:hypothetical protein
METGKWVRGRSEDMQKPITRLALSAAIAACVWGAAQPAGAQATYDINVMVSLTGGGAFREGDQRKRRHPGHAGALRLP